MDDRFEAVAAFVAQKTGLALSDGQRAELRKFLQQRSGFTGGTAATYIARLDDPVEFRLLIDGLTVKETFFNRFEAQFDAFRDHLLPGFLARARDEQRPVRLWSAGCCTGEEAYTLAIVAAEAGCLDAVEILATDINEGYLEAALVGSYSRRSVEKLPPEVIARYFTAERDRFLLREGVRRRVTFKYLNLGEPCYPSFLNGTTALDMILCRNVLIYFDREKVRTIVEAFGECLQPDGVVAFGHSEMLPREWPLVVRQIGEAFFYGARHSAPETPVTEAPETPTARRPIVRPAVPAVVTTKPVVVEDAGPLLMRAEQLADRGESAEALRLCRAVLAKDPSAVHAHYLLGLLELDRPADAYEHFRKAVYLTPEHLPARLHLAQCADKLGRSADAVREYRNLERLARHKPPHEVLDPKEGITYGIVALIAKSGIDRYEKGPATT